MKTLILLFGLASQAVACQDVARPVPNNEVRRMPYVYVPIPLVRLNGLLPAPGMVWLRIYNPYYRPGEEI